MKDKKLTYSNWSLKVKLWIERKYTIKLIPVKSYKKATVFVAYGKVTGRYHKSFPKPSKGVCIIAIPFKANASLCSNAMFPSILESPRLVRNLPPHKKETKKDVILQKTLCYILSLVQLFLGWKNPKIWCKIFCMQCLAEWEFWCFGAYTTMKKHRPCGYFKWALAVFKICQFIFHRSGK